MSIRRIAPDVPRLLDPESDASAELRALLEEGAVLPDDGVRIDRLRVRLEPWFAAGASAGAVEGARRVVEQATPSVAPAASAGVAARARPATPTASSTPRDGRATATPSAPSATRPSTGAARRRRATTATTPVSAIQAMSRASQPRPTRVSSTSPIALGSRAAQNVVPPAVAPWSTMPATPATMPSTRMSRL